jgi:class 3 adenylate cyclase
MQQVGRGRQLIQYDSRGAGLSQREVSDMTYSAALRDLEAVVHALGLDRFSLWGRAVGGPWAIEYAARHPEQIEKLVLSGTFARLLDVFSREMIQGFAQLARANWEVASRTFADLGIRRRNEQEGLRWAEWCQKSISAEGMAAFLEGSLEIDVTHLLPNLKCPTLVLHYIQDPLYPFTVGQRLAEAIPNASLVPLEGSGAGFGGYTQPAIEKIDAFLSGVTAAVGATRNSLPTGTAVILFADIADSTALTERVGDAAFRLGARELDRTLRHVIRNHSGTPIEGKLLGDGVLAVFSSARQAIEAALACARSGDDAGLPLHLGLHAGDVIREENNVYGGAVNIASRISGLSAAGEVLVSDTVRSLARTSAGVRFEDRGRRKLKGVAEAARVWAVTEADR